MGNMFENMNVEKVPKKEEEKPKGPNVMKSVMLGAGMLAASLGFGKGVEGGGNPEKNVDTIEAVSPDSVDKETVKVVYGKFDNKIIQKDYTYTNEALHRGAKQLAGGNIEVTLDNEVFKQISESPMGLTPGAVKINGENYPVTFASGVARELYAANGSTKPIINYSFDADKIPTDPNFVVESIAPKLKIRETVNYED